MVLRSATETRQYFLSTLRCVMGIEWSIETSKQTQLLYCKGKKSFLCNHATCFGLRNHQAHRLSVLFHFHSPEPWKDA